MCHNFATHVIVSLFVVFTLYSIFLHEMVIRSKNNSYLIFESKTSSLRAVVPICIKISLQCLFANAIDT